MPKHISVNYEIIISDPEWEMLLNAYLEKAYHVIREYCVKKDYDVPKVTVELHKDIGKLKAMIHENNAKSSS